MCPVKIRLVLSVTRTNTAKVGSKRGTLVLVLCHRFGSNTIYVLSLPPSRGGGFVYTDEVSRLEVSEGRVVPRRVQTLIPTFSEKGD